MAPHTSGLLPTCSHALCLSGGVSSFPSHGTNTTTNFPSKHVFQIGLYDCFYCISEALWLPYALASLPHPSIFTPLSIPISLSYNCPSFAPAYHCLVFWSLFLNSALSFLTKKHETVKFCTQSLCEFKPKLKFAHGLLHVCHPRFPCCCLHCFILQNVRNNTVTIKYTINKEFAILLQKPNHYLKYHSGLILVACVPCCTWSDVSVIQALLPVFWCYSGFNRFSFARSEKYESRCSLLRI